MEACLSQRVHVASIPGDPNNSPKQVMFIYFRPQSRYRLHTLGPKIGIIYILGSPGSGSYRGLKGLPVAATATSSVFRESNLRYCSKASCIELYGI